MLAVLASAMPAAAKPPRFSPSTGQSALYACADGRTIEVLYSGGDAAVLTIAGATVQLARAAAADGERYVGGGWQWWGTGRRDGALSRIAAGEEVAATPGTDCRAR
ncbi:MliC family protein [Sphingomonas sp. BIUV-7]|uniref:MliC family protein n=2 Tax=Sphingomonas natans TaxID=3063330 RepID=A0ABT8Y5A6_9SPHN|nr:MliC family protein [Sphingomonas sp. BIUV-7]